MLSRFRKVLRNTALAALAGLAVVGAAQAKLVVGVFDPDFGGTLTGTNFSGTATFSISQACLDLNLPSTGFLIPYFAPCTGGSSGMAFVGAHVDFSGAHTGVLDFASASNEILGMYVRDHEVIGVWSRAIGPTQSDLVGSYDPSFYLQFGPLFPPNGNIFGMLDGGDLGDFFAAPFQQTYLYLVSSADCTPGHGCEQSSAAQTSYVPEPGSMELVLGALGIAGIVGVTRRRVPRAVSRRLASRTA